MAISKSEILDQLTDKWMPTNTIAKKLSSSWHVTFGLLCILYKDGIVDNQEVTLCGTRKTMLWRRKRDE